MIVIKNQDVLVMLDFHYGGHLKCWMSRYPHELLEKAV